jgi:SAM-dependent methyltransferase
MTLPPPDWRALNQANWDERVPIHVKAKETYDLAALRAGTSRLDAIAAEVLGQVENQRVLHLQCHFGMDSLKIAARGASVTGVDFSPPAIATARSLAAELGLTERARFVEANVYDALTALPEPDAFDRVFVTWGALCWLPNLFDWARVVAAFLAPGGYLALADAHPFAYVFDSATATADRMPGWYVPYLGRQASLEDDPRDYADPAARLNNSRTWQWLHPVSDILAALSEAGLRVERFQEHDLCVWRMFDNLIERRPGEFAWPDRPWLPLAFSLRAVRP